MVIDLSFASREGGAGERGSLGYGLRHVNVCLNIFRMSFQFLFWFWFRSCANGDK